MVFSQLAIPVNAEPKIDEATIKKYQAIIDSAVDKKLSPKKQIDIGIQMLDVVCFDNNVPVLKLTDNFVTCVNSNTATKLIERGWGVTKNEEKFDNSHGSECSNTWVIHYEKLKPENSIIIKKLRNEIKQFSEFLLWHPIQILTSDEKTLVVLSNGNFNDAERSEIINALEEIELISKVEHKKGGCL